LDQIYKEGGRARKRSKMKEGGRVIINPLFFLNIDAEIT
jgi:hypothetical protein